jgi:glycosyltransferase involved in cell wall biosynthesis
VQARPQAPQTVEPYTPQGEELAIGFVSDVMYPFHVGGAEKRIYEIGRRLSESHEVHLFTMGWGQDGTDEMLDGMHMHKVGPVRSVYADGDGRRSTRSSLLFAKDCLGAIPTNEFDVLDFTQAPYLHFLAHRLFKPWDFTPTIFTVHDTWWPHWDDYLSNPIQRQLARWVEKTSYQLADEILAVSQTTAYGIRQTGVDPDKIHVAPNGVDFEQLANSTPDEDGYDIVYTGRLNGYKNVDLLVQAVKCLEAWGHDVRAGIVGQGPEREHLEELVHDQHLEDRVELLGYLPDIEDVYGLMKASNVLVQPSNVEGFGIVALEALSTGTPVLTLDSATNATTELVLDEELGDTFGPPATNLAAKLERWIYRDEDPRKKTVRQQFGRVLDWNRVAERVDRLYHDVAERGAP